VLPESWTESPCRPEARPDGALAFDAGELDQGWPELDCEPARLAKTKVELQQPFC
jgi:hypothetical protein